MAGILTRPNLPVTKNRFYARISMVGQAFLPVLDTYQNRKQVMTGHTCDLDFGISSITPGLIVEHPGSRYRSGLIERSTARDVCPTTSPVVGINDTSAEAAAVIAVVVVIDHQVQASVDRGGKR